MVVRLSAGQTKRAGQLTTIMEQITAAIRRARSDEGASPQVVKQLLDRYCETEAEFRSLIPKSTRSLP